MKYEYEINKIKSLLPYNVYELLKKNKAIVAGGCITSLFTRGEIHDIDIYLPNEESMMDVLEYMLHKTHMKCCTKKAVLFSNKINNENDIQIICFKTFKTPQEIFDTFDFTINMGAFSLDTEEFTFYEDFFKHNSQRILKTNPNTAFPLISLLRSNKYIERGYYISKPELLKICLMINNKEFKSYEEVEEQLGGMYGIDYESIFKNIDTDKPFDINEVIESLNELSLNEDYFISKNKEKEYMKNYNNLMFYLYSKLEYNMYKVDDSVIITKDNEIYKILDSDYIDEDMLLDTNNVFVYMYKNVCDSIEGLVSFYNNSFRYNLGKVIEDKNHGMYFVNNINETKNSYGSNKENRIILKCIVYLKDIKYLGSEIRVTSCIPTETIYQD